LIPLVHHELHRIARRCMYGEGAGHSLQATALINEAYLRLVDGKAVAWTDRAHFLAVSARIMRRILVDHARARRTTKRGGAALQALAAFDERKSRVIELRFFGGLSVEEAASVLDVSPDTVMRDWRLAKAWLQGEMRRASGEPR
jgi:DNA-directed RNA polymerase specialized sigma24 family protein